MVGCAGSAPADPLVGRWKNPGQTIALTANGVYYVVGTNNFSCYTVEDGKLQLLSGKTGRVTVVPFSFAGETLIITAFNGKQLPFERISDDATLSDSEQEQIDLSVRNGATACPAK